MTRASRTWRRCADPSRPRRLRCRGDEGAALVEAAFISPVFLLVLFGVLEFGGAYRDYLTVNNAAVAATRQEAVQGANVQADWLTLQAIKKASRAFPVTDIEYIVVWKASGPTDSVPTNCKTSGQTLGTATAPTNGSCNRFTVSDLQSTTGDAWTCASPDPIQYWCPTTRKVALSSNSGNGPDYLGVYIQMKHNYITGFFGKSVTLSASSVTKLEPATP
ncbi:MAG TPA: TadE/TadG family type IV pilus assembly protein [Acidimicrobiales bacterium]